MTNERIKSELSRRQLVGWATAAIAAGWLPLAGWADDDDSSLMGNASTLALANTDIVGKHVVVVGGGDTSIDVASVARRLGHITHKAEKDVDPHDLLGYTAHDVAGTMTREGMQATLTSLFPIEKMTASEREREDAKREGVTIIGGVLPLEVLRHPDGRARALKMCKCTMKGTAPVPTPDTEFEIECDIIISAIGQMGDFTGIAALDGGRHLILDACRGVAAEVAGVDGKGAAGAFDHAGKRFARKQRVGGQGMAQH